MKPGGRGGSSFDGRSQPWLTETSSLEGDLMSNDQEDPKKDYNSPELKDHGDIRDVTLGSSVGNFESGFPNTFFAGFGPQPPGKGGRR